MYRGSRSTNFGASASVGSNPSLGRLTTPSFSSITMLNKGGTRSSGGGNSGWDSHGSGYRGASNMGQSWNQGGTQNMGGGRQMEPYNTSVFLNMENAPPEFDAVTRVIGENGENLDYIRKTTGGQIQLQGRGTGIVNSKGLHIYIEHNQMPGLERGEKLAGDLVKVVQEEFMQWQEEAKGSRMGGGSSGYQGNQRNQGGRGYNDSGHGDFGNQGYQDRQQDMGYTDGGRGGNYQQDSQLGRDSDGVNINRAKEAKPGIAGGYGNSQGGDNFSGGRFNEGMRDGSERQIGHSDRGVRGQSYGQGGQGSNWRGSDQQERRQDWTEGQQGRRDTSSNFGRGSGQSDFRDGNQGNQDFQGQNRMESSGVDSRNWSRQDTFNRDQGSRDNMAMNSGNQARFNEPANRGIERNIDRTMDRGMDRNMDRTVDRTVDRGIDRNMDRGMDRNMDRGMDRNIDRGMDRNMENRGLDRNMDNRGIDRNMDNRGIDRNMDNRGMDRNMDNRGIDRNMDRNVDNRGMDRNIDRGMNNRGIDRGVNNRGMDRNIERNGDGRGIDRNVDNRGMDRGTDNRGMDRGMGRNMDNRGGAERGVENRGMGRNIDNRGMDRNMDSRGMGRNVDNRGGMERRVEPAPRQSQAKYCDICDAKFPNDEEYQVHCNGVFHAQKVLEMKNRSQGQRGGNFSGGGVGGGEGGNVQRGDKQASRGPPQPLPDVWYPNSDGTFEQRWVFNQVEPMFERQLEGDILKKLQEHCRNTNEDLLPDRAQQHPSNYCKLCKSTFDSLDVHVNGHYHITQYVLRQLQMGVNDFVNYYGDVPIADVNTNGGRILALEALAWGPCLPEDSKPQLRERFKKLVVLSGPFLGFKCQLCKARCRNMTFWVDHLTSQKHAKRIVRAVCALRKDGFSREFTDIPVCPPYFAAGCVLKLQGLRWHPEVQVPGSVLRAEPKNFLSDRAWSDAGPPDQMGNNRGPAMNDMGRQGAPGPRQQRDGARGGQRDGPGGPRGGNGPRRPDAPGGFDGGPRGGPSGPRSGPRPLMDEPMSRGGPDGPGPRGSDQEGPMGQRPGPERQLGPKPLMGMESATAFENLNPADRDLVRQVAGLTGISDATLVVSALEALRALDPNMLTTLGALNTEAMPDLDPAMIQTLLDAVVGGGAEGPGPGPMGPSPRPGPHDKRRMPMDRSGGPPKKMRF